MEDRAKMPSTRQITTEHEKEKKRKEEAYKSHSRTRRAAPGTAVDPYNTPPPPSNRMYTPYIRKHVRRADEPPPFQFHPLPPVVSSRKQCLAPPCLPLAVAVATSCAYIGRDALGGRAVGGRGRDALGAIGGRGGGAVRSLLAATARIAMGGGVDRRGEETRSRAFLYARASGPRSASAPARMCVV